MTPTRFDRLLRYLIGSRVLSSTLAYTFPDSYALLYIIGPFRALLLASETWLLIANILH